MNSNMVKPEKFGHLLLVYHFTVPLNWRSVAFMDHIETILGWALVIHLTHFQPRFHFYTP